MTREDARQYIVSRSKEYLQRDNSGTGYICPICGSGTGRKGTGITTKDGVHYTCWTGCYTNSDIIDIIGLEYGVRSDDYNSKLMKAADLFNITIDHSRSTAEEDFSPVYQNKPKIEQNTQQTIHNDVDIIEPEKKPDYMDLYLEYNKDLWKTDYHRGISMDTLNRFKVGFVEEWRHPKASDKVPTSPRLIIPTSKVSYLALDTRSNLSKEQQRYRKQKVGAVHIFNIQTLQKSQKPIFIVEGEVDALSIIDVGGEALGLGSVEQRKALLKRLENETPAQPLILALDSDDPGRKASQDLKEGLEKLKMPYCEANVNLGYKDPNEALNADRIAFKAAVEDAMKCAAEAKEEAQEAEAEALEAERERLKKESVAYTLQDFIQSITDSKTAPYFPTGFPSLDKFLDGGLYSGLYIAGAISSLGKTTFCLQACDNIAQTGQDVLIFSLEMSRRELVAKSVSRTTLILDMARNGSTTNAKSTRGILTGKKYKYYSQEEKNLIRDAIGFYGRYGQNIYITEGVGDVGVGQIREKTQQYIKVTGKIPVILIDYIQILSPMDIRASDKQNMDRNVLELKRISRDFNVPILGISSFNRDNYTEPVNLAAFKESGAIEYSSDVLLGLQYAGMDYQGGEKDTDRKKRIRELLEEQEQKGRNGQAQDIQVKVLKNRNGTRGSTELDFYPRFNYFSEKKETWEEEENGDWTGAEGNY